MYRINYIKDSVTMPVYVPFDDRYTITAGTYHRETNTIGKLTFSVPHSHPHHGEFEEYSGVMQLSWGGALLYESRIISIKRDLYNTLTVTCEGLLGYFNDSIAGPYTFNANHWLYPTGSGTHTCTVTEFLTELIALHNTQVSAAQQFTFVDETGGAFDSIEFTTSQTSRVKTWDEIESKVLKNVGGYIQIVHRGGENCVVYRAALTDANEQEVRFAVNLKELSFETDTRKFATALCPVSTYTDANNARQTIDIYNVNDGKYYVQNDNAVAAYGRIIETVQYEGIVSPERLKWIASRDLSAYINRGKPVSVSAVDMAVTGSVEPLEVDKLTRIVSPPNGVDINALLNAFDVNLLDPSASSFTFNGEVPSFVRKTYIYRT